MKLTTKSEYILLALLFIARHPGDEFVKIEDICRQYKISKKYLEQLFLLLKQNNIVKTKRGSNGGYKLAKHPAEISLAQIIRLMDGALAPTGSVSTYFFNHTPIESEKKILAVMKEIRDYITMRLENSTLQDFI
jgi:Rrf2 family transcriptional regulator, cysteine metabolism repressor